CKRFKNVREWLSYDVVVGIDTNFDKNLKKYCNEGSCDDLFDKINAGCLYLFDEFFAGFTQFTSVAKRKINIVDYILIWLGYMLNLIIDKDNGSIETFYNTYINNYDKDNKYNKRITGVTVIPYFINNNNFCIKCIIYTYGKGVLRNPIFKCKKFQDVEDWFLDELGSDGENQFKHPEDLQKYCITKCNSNLDKINAGCLYLLDQFYKHDGMFPSPSRSNPNIVDNIFIWLSYMLNMDKTINYNGIKYLYDNYITKRGTYKEHINGLIGYSTYKELIDDRKGFLNMDKTIVSKFYEALKSLCKLYNELGDDNKNCKNYLEDNSEFFKKYNDLKQNTSFTKNSYDSQIFSTLLKDYDGFKKECEVALSPPSDETKQNHGLTPEQYSGQYSGLDLELDLELDSGQESESSSEATSSSSSITSKLIPVLLILGAIGFFIGISYKYSLFGFRKRVQKHLREKLKK
ncbi:hypothetical protein YYC_02116, partial [Plasmodium yoelii 17X]